MLGKFRWTSAVALVGTLSAAFAAAHASGAAAEVGIVLPDTPTQFVSNPVVQPLPTDATPLPIDGAAPDDQDPAQSPSLDALVAAQPAGGSLSSELRCLAGAVYFEARGESLSGQLAVARVVVDRATSGRFPDSYCGVVYQPEQFSFVRGRSMPAIRAASAAWREAIAVARIADEGTWTSPAKGALYFHAARVSPGWRLTRLARVDNHIFYR